MHTTLYRSLALLVSMFALTSSFSLSMTTTNSKQPFSDSNKEEDAWVLEMVESKNPGISIQYTVKRTITNSREQSISKFYKKIMEGPHFSVGTLLYNADSTFCAI